MILRDHVEPGVLPQRDGDQSLERRAYDAVLEWLVKGHGKPGQPIPLREFAKALGMSRTPLRTALGRLQEQGIVSYSGRLGFMANIPSVSDLYELFDIRAMCETHALRTFLSDERSSVPADIVDLAQETLRISHDDPPTPATAEAFWVADNRFHHAIVTLGRNQRLVSWWDLLHVNIHIQRAGWRAPLTSDRFQQSAREHIAIVDAMMEGEGEQAARILEAHLMRVRDQTIQFMMQPESVGVQ